MEKTKLKLVGNQNDSDIGQTLGNGLGQTLDDFIEHEKIINWKAGDNVVISGENYYLQEVLKEANERCTYKALKTDGKIKKLKVIQFFRKEKAIEAKQKLFEIYRKANTAYSDKNDFDYRLINANNLDLIIECNYLEGKDARQVLKDNNRNFTQQEIVDCLLSVLNDDIKKLHTQGLVHRDINPNNLIGNVVDGKLDYRLVDVGSAREIGTGLTTGAGELFTYPYTRISAFHDSSDDFYSLARLSYFLLTGKEPECCITDKKADELCDGRNYNSLKIDKKLRKILFKMSGHKDKYENCEELIKDLEDIKNFKSSRNLDSLEQSLVKSKGESVSNLKVAYEITKNLFVGTAKVLGYIVGSTLGSFALPSVTIHEFALPPGITAFSYMIALGGSSASFLWGWHPTQGNETAREIFYAGIATNVASGLVESLVKYARHTKNKLEKENPAIVANEKGFYQKWKENREIKREERKQEEAKKDLELRVYREERIIPALHDPEHTDKHLLLEHENLRREFFAGLIGKILSEEGIAEKIYKNKFTVSLEKAKEIAKEIILRESYFLGYSDDSGNKQFAAFDPVLGRNSEKLYKLGYYYIDTNYY